MGRENQLQDAISIIYEAVLDPALWPQALTTLADAVGVGQIALGAFDHRTHRFDALAPRVDPVMLASYKDYWALRDPIWPLIAAQPAGEPFPLTSLIPRDDFTAGAVYNEWFRPAKVGWGVLAANLRADDQFSSTIFAANPPDKEEISSEQALVFKTALPHFDRAFRLHHKLRVADLGHDGAPEQLEGMGFGVMLVDASAKVLFANAWARALLCPGSGLVFRGGYLFSTDRAACLHRLIASCAGRRVVVGSGGEIVLRRGARRSLRVKVIPLRARGSAAELPWIGLKLPVAMITISIPAMASRPN